ncbi:MAG: hypothetical protein Kow0098_00040 [Ignavibacteriaceae bacterium]
MSEPTIAQKGPYEILMKPGTYKWCSCGLSITQPFCDDSHLGTDFEPITVTIEKEEVVYWCGCKHSGNKPFCDDTHLKL